MTAQKLDLIPNDSSPRGLWLGQAGFLWQWSGMTILIDPYLSDALAQKYQGTRFPHQRMMPPPLTVQDLPEIHWVLCTHQHTDHMDAQTLLPILQNFPECQFLVPKAWAHKMEGFGIGTHLIQALDAGESLTLGPACTVYALPSAHEQLEVNAEGHHHFLGYVLHTPFGQWYHSGDSIPYPRLQAYLQQHAIDYAFLPVNGRDAHRASQGVPGNFTIEEAVNLCIELKIDTLVCHHFGMFEFNTVDPSILITEKARVRDQLQLLIPEPGQWISLGKVKPKTQ
jgi:L-ascorbate metabolism protein UlaG (beta-lactamase superfamily)